MPSCEVVLLISPSETRIIDYGRNFPLDRYRAFMERHGIRTRVKQVSPCG